MTILRTLLWKEWRDHWPLLAVAVPLATLLILGGEHLYGHEFDAELRARYLPFLLWLFLGVLCADVATRDHGNGASEVLGRLPVPWRLVWVPRVVFVLAAGALFLGFLAGIEVLVQRGEGLKTVDLVSLVSSHTLLVAGMVSLGVLGAGGLARRPLPAFLAGVLVPVGLPLALRLLPRSPLADWTILVLSAGGWTPVHVSTVLAAALAAAALLGHSPWRDRGRREGLWILAGLALVLLPFGVTRSRRAWRATNLVPFGPSGNVGRLFPSPDGRYVALEVFRTLGWGRSWEVRWHRIDRDSMSRSEVWLLDRETGEVVELDQRHRVLRQPRGRGWSDSPWGDDGRLLTYSNEGPASNSGPLRFERIDPRTKQVSVRPADELAPWYEMDLSTQPPRVRCRETGRTFAAPDGKTYPTPVPGTVLYERDGMLVRRELASGDERELVPLLSEWRVRQSPDGRYLLLYQEDRERLVLESDTGRVLAAGKDLGGTFCAAEGQVLVMADRLLRDDGTWIELAGSDGVSYYPFDEEHVWTNPDGLLAAGVDLVHIETGEVTPLYAPR